MPRKRGRAAKRVEAVEGVPSNHETAKLSGNGCKTWGSKIIQENAERPEGVKNKEKGAKGAKKRGSAATAVTFEEDGNVVEMETEGLHTDYMSEDESDPEIELSQPDERARKIKDGKQGKRKTKGGKGHKIVANDTDSDSESDAEDQVQTRGQGHTDDDQSQSQSQSQSEDDENGDCPPLMESESEGEIPDTPPPKKKTKDQIC